MITQLNNMISIIIVSYNTKELLLKCLDSVKSNVSDCEIIVIDNASKDGSVEAVKERFPDVHLIEEKENLGFAKAANKGIKASNENYVLLLNSDCEISKGVIDAMKKFLEENNNVGAVGPQLISEDWKKQNSFDNFPSLATSFINKSFLKIIAPSRFPSKHQIRSEPFEVESLIGACLLTRKDVINNIGLLDEDYFLFLEETDWCLKMKKNGYKIFLLPQVEVFHKQGASKKKREAEAKIEYLRSLYVYFKKNRNKAENIFFRFIMPFKFYLEFLIWLFIGLLVLFQIPEVRKRIKILFRINVWHFLFRPEGFGIRD